LFTADDHDRKWPARTQQSQDVADRKDGIAMLVFRYVEKLAQPLN
jgi:hypothetical protein